MKFSALEKITTTIRYSSNRTRPVILGILDGFGNGPKLPNNAIHKAKKPVWDSLSYGSKTFLHASGESVGLPKWQAGNSEAGHTVIGAGSVVAQDLSLINNAIASGEFYRNPVFNDAITMLQHNNRKLHIFGLLSPGGTHSHEDHLLAMLQICVDRGFSDVYLHLVIDGRSREQFLARDSLFKLQNFIDSNQVAGKPVAQIASMIGRDYALNRNFSWDKTEKAYNLLADPYFPVSSNSVYAELEIWYKHGNGDAYFPATRFLSDGFIKNNDICSVFNYRSDRVLQIMETLLVDDFKHFSRAVRPKLAYCISMMPYAEYLPTISAFKPARPITTLGKIVSDNGLRQVRLAEREKAAHVGRFFNGGNENYYPNEDRVILESPKVARYDLLPEMAAREVTAAVVAAILSAKYDLIIFNLANADMVGHTGNLDAAIQAIECIDNCLYQILSAAHAVGGHGIITADHGNADIMYDIKTKKPHTGHTHALVPCVYFGKKGVKLRQGEYGLIDVAPTILHLLGLESNGMQGQSLLSAKVSFFQAQPKDHSLADDNLSQPKLWSIRA